MTFSSTTTEGRVVDVDYSDLEIEAGRIGRFDFNLFADSARSDPVEFTDMWVRIAQEDDSKAGKILFAGGVAKQDFGGNGFSFVFPEGGKYTLSVSYNDANKDRSGEAVAEAEFPLEVLRSSDENTFKFGSIEFMVGLASGAFVALLGLLPMLIRKRNA